MVGDLKSRSGMDISSWEALFTEGVNEEAWTQGAEERRIWEELKPIEPWSQREELVHSESRGARLTQELNEADRGSSVRIVGKSQDIGGKKVGRMTWSRGILAALLALGAGYFLLREFLPLWGSNSVDEVGLGVEGQNEGAPWTSERGHELRKTEQSDPFSQSPAMSSKDVEIKFRDSDRHASAGSKGNPLLKNRHEEGSAEIRRQVMEGGGHPGIEAGVNGERRRVYSVHVGSFKIKENADILIDQLKNAGYDARKEFITLPKKGSWYRVLVGTFKTREDATSISVNLKQAEDLPALVLEGNAH